MAECRSKSPQVSSDKDRTLSHNSSLMINVYLWPNFSHVVNSTLPVTENVEMWFKCRNFRQQMHLIYLLKQFY
jgi:hypothetical protein